jgi:hypothetical protein
MKNKILALFIAFLLSGTNLSAQEAENNEVINRSNELGMHAGFTTGLGLSFRHWSDKFGVQITAIPIKANDFQFISAGLTGMYSLSNQKYYRFYLYLGNHILLVNNSTTWDGRNVNENIYNIGFGPGFEVGRKVRFNIMAGYGAYDLLNAPDYSLLPTIEAGLYFKLK